MGLRNLQKTSGTDRPSIKTLGRLLESTFGMQSENHSGEVFQVSTLTRQEDQDDLLSKQVPD